MFLNESNAFIFDFLKQNFDFGGKKESKSNQNKNKTLIFQCHLSECLVICEPIIRWEVLTVVEAIICSIFFGFSAHFQFQVVGNILI